MQLPPRRGLLEQMDTSAKEVSLLDVQMWLASELSYENDDRMEPKIDSASPWRAK